MNSAARDEICSLLDSRKRWAQQRALGLQYLARQAERGILALLWPVGVSLQSGFHPKAVLKQRGVAFPALSVLRAA